MKLHDLPTRLFQGVAPAIIATCDADGIPNVTYLSQVFLLDREAGKERVALSCQFFNKTKKNVLVNPLACTQLLDPLTFEAYRLVIRYDHAETEGPTFDQMSRRIDAIASHTGMTGIFRLLSADIYDVVSVEKVNDFTRPLPVAVEAEAPGGTPHFKTEMFGLQHVSQCVSRARTLDELFTTTLAALEEALGFENSMILLLDESGTRLYAIAGRGYGEAGIGAEVGLGEGLIGTVARERCILRVAGVGAELRYGRAIRTSVQRATGNRNLRPEIPLPGLVDAQSQMALPLVVGSRLVGVIAVESRAPAAFEAWHEAFLEIIANQIAAAIENTSLREKDGDDAEEATPGPASATATATATETRTAKREGPCPEALQLRFFKSDDCVFAGDEYLVRNVPGRILWKMLREYTGSGRTEFSNRELRLDAALGLPAIRDNLESRLVLLRKRLEQKCPKIKIVPVARGRFRLSIDCAVDLSECA